MNSSTALNNGASVLLYSSANGSK